VWIYLVKEQEYARISHPIVQQAVRHEGLGRLGIDRFVDHDGERQWTAQEFWSVRPDGTGFDHGQLMLPCAVLGYEPAQRPANPQQPMPDVQPIYVELARIRAMMYRIFDALDIEVPADAMDIRQVLSDNALREMGIGPTLGHTAGLTRVDFGDVLAAEAVARTGHTVGLGRLAYTTSYAHLPAEVIEEIRAEVAGRQPRGIRIRERNGDDAGTSHPSSPEENI
jgi:hypothetical protein